MRQGELLLGKLRELEGREVREKQLFATRENDHDQDGDLHSGSDMSSEEDEKKEENKEEEEQKNVVVVDSTSWVEKQIGERAPMGALIRLETMTMESIQSMFVQYMNTDAMLNAVLGPRDIDENKTPGAGGESAKM